MNPTKESKIKRVLLGRSWFTFFKDCCLPCRTLITSEAIKEVKTAKRDKSNIQADGMKEILNKKLCLQCYTKYKKWMGEVGDGI